MVKGERGAGNNPTANAAPYLSEEGGLEEMARCALTQLRHALAELSRGVGDLVGHVNVLLDRRHAHLELG